MDILMQHMGHGIGLILLLSMPSVLLAAAIGLVVGILQAVTQVQEQTIAAAPKIVLVFMLIIFGGPAMMQILENYMRESANLAMEVIPHEDNRILPPKPRMAYSSMQKEDFFKIEKRAPSESKVRAMMNHPTGGGMTEYGTGMSVHSNKPQPKPSVSEKIYMNRRQAGNLPKPPGQ